jgi:hypothetical protein
MSEPPDLNAPPNVHECTLVTYDGDTQRPRAALLTTVGVMRERWLLAKGHRVVVWLPTWREDEHLVQPGDGIRVRWYNDPTGKRPEMILACGSDMVCLGPEGIWYDDPARIAS